MPAGLSAETKGEAEKPSTEDFAARELECEGSGKRRLRKDEYRGYARRMEQRQRARAIERYEQHGEDQYRAVGDPSDRLIFRNGQQQAAVSARKKAGATVGQSMRLRIALVPP